MAPDFDIPVLIGGVRKQFRLSEHRGKRNLVLAFYPVKLGPGQRPADGRLTRWSGKNFRSRQAEVLGISVDHIMNATAWEREIGPFDFLLASDFWPHGEVSRKYGVLRESEPFQAPASAPFLWSTSRAGSGLQRIYPVDQLPDLEETLKRCASSPDLRHASATRPSRSPMKFISAAVLPSVLFSILFLSNMSGTSQSALSGKGRRAPLFGFRNSADEMALESRFLAVPDPKLAEEHLRILTQAPHMAGTPEDKATADYVAQKFREAGLETEIVEYRVWMNYPAEISVDVTAPAGVTMHGPARERVNGDPYQDDPRVVMPFNSMSPSGDVEAEVVYANYGSPDDFQKLEQMKIDVRGKIVLVRYGQNFRGVKAFVAQEHGAAGVLIYSDPADDGWRHGDKYPQGPWRPDTGVQRGSIGYMFQYPGDPTTPGNRLGAIACRIPNARLRNRRRSCPKFPRRRFPTRTRGPSSSIWVGRIRRAIGRARCLSPTTSGPARPK